MLFVNAELKVKNIAETELYIHMKYSNTALALKHQSYSLLHFQRLSSQSKLILDKCAEALVHAVTSTCILPCMYSFLWSIPPPPKIFYCHFTS